MCRAAIFGQRDAFRRAEEEQAEGPGAEVTDAQTRAVVIEMRRMGDLRNYWVMDWGDLLGRRLQMLRHTSVSEC